MLTGWSGGRMMASLDQASGVSSTLSGLFAIKVLGMNDTMPFQITNYDDFNKNPIEYFILKEDLSKSVKKIFF